MTFQYLNPSRTLATWETCGDDVAFARYDFVVVRPEQPGYAPAVVDRTLAELVHVAPEDAAAAMDLIEGFQPSSIRRLLAAHGIAAVPEDHPRIAVVDLPKLAVVDKREAA